MASWGVYLALAGFEYHGPKGHLGFAPKLTPDDFKTAFTAAQGWGIFEQTREGDGQIERIMVVWGKRRLKSLSFAVSAPFQSVSVTVNERTVPVMTEDVDGRTIVTLRREVTVDKGGVIEIRFG